MTLKALKIYLFSLIFALTTPLSVSPLSLFSPEKRLERGVEIRLETQHASAQPEPSQAPTLSPPKEESTKDPLKTPLKNRVKVQVLSPQQSPAMRRALMKLDARKAKATKSSIKAQSELRARLKDKLRRQATLPTNQKRFVKFPLTEPLPLKELRTTSCDLFLNNLESRFKSVRSLYLKDPKSPSAQVAYIATLYARAQLYSDLEGVAEAAKLIDTGLGEHPRDAKLHHLRARVAMTLHQIPRARTEIDWLTTHLPKASALRKELKAMKVELELESGERIAEHLKEMSAGYKRGDYRGYLLAARARELSGEVSLAQRYYGQAERRFKDVAPIPLAWLNVQRGLMAMHSGDFKSARTFFRAGYERCPRYPMAAEHLAEIEGRMGDLKRSSELYEAVVKQTQHPEFMAALAEIYLERGMKAEAQKLIKDADVRFRQLDQLVPEAVSGHAADFYLGLGGSPDRAFELLTRNHELRPNTHAKQALADILIERGDLKGASTLVQETLESPVEFAEKYWTAAKLSLAQGDTGAATQHMKRARAMNPRITEFEGELMMEKLQPKAPQPTPPTQARE